MTIPQYLNHDDGSKVTEAIGAADLSEHKYDMVAAFAASPLNWNVSRVPMWLDSTTRVKTHDALVREDTGEIMQLAPKSYNEFQNAEVAALAGTIVGKENGISVHSAGVIDNGRLNWLQLKLGEGFETKPGHYIEQYQTWLWSHDQSYPLMVRNGMENFICRNLGYGVGYGAAGCKQGIKLKHTKNLRSEANKRRLLSAVGFARHTAAVGREFLTAAVRKQWTKGALDRFIAEMAPATKRNEETGELMCTKQAENIREIVRRYTFDGAGQDGRSLTVYDAWQGWTEYNTHDTGRGDNRLARNFVNNIAGPQLEANQRAYQHLARALCR